MAGWGEGGEGLRWGMGWGVGPVDPLGEVAEGHVLADGDGGAGGVVLADVGARGVGLAGEEG